MAAGREVLTLHPADAATRQLLVVCYLRQADRTAAQKAFDDLMALNPPQADELRRWFAEQMRSR